MQKPCFNKTISLLLCLVSSLLSLPIYAQQAAKDELDFFTDIPNVITVSRLSQPAAEAPSSVTIIDRKMIEASGATEIADIFRMAPGFIVGKASDQTNAYRTVVTYQGLGQLFSRQMQVLIDGRSVFIPSFGGVPWDNLPLMLENIDRVEITRGPNAASYGANSFLAIINIITRDPSQDTGVQYKITHSLNDYRQDKQTYLSYNHKNKDLDWKISAKAASDQGFDPYNNSIEKRNDDSKEINKLNFSSNFNISQSDNLSFQLGYNKTRADVGICDPSTCGSTPLILLEDKVKNYFQSLKYETTKEGQSTTIQFFNTVHDLRNQTLITPGNLDFNRKSERTELEIQHINEPNDSVRYVLGGSIREDKVLSYYLFADYDKHIAKTSRLFGHVEYTLNDSQLVQLGAMVESSTTADTAISPRISFIQHLSNKHILRLSASTANRNPILFETEGQQGFLLTSGTHLDQSFPNPDLKPEKNTNYEIALNSTLTKQLQSTIKLFQYELNQQIVIHDTTSTNVFIHKNNAETHVEGVEASIDYQQKDLTIKSGISKVTANSTDSNLERTFPNISGFITADYQITPQHSVSGLFSYIDPFKWVDYSSGPTETPIRKLDLRYEYKFKDKNNTRIELIGHNLWEDYYDYFKQNIHKKAYLLRLTGSF